jgi:acyl-CoA thioester hydrolase
MLLEGGARAMPIFVETYRATVAPADCDHLGHMNVQHYFAAVSDGMFAIMVRLGLGPEEIRRRQISFAVVRAETDFHRELRPGDVMALESTVLALGEKSATFHHRLKDVAAGDIAMSTVVSNRSKAARSVALLLRDERFGRRPDPRDLYDHLAILRP